MSDGTATPQWLFDILDEQVKEQTGQHFQLDAAAAAWNAKCGDYYDEELDALKQNWSEFGVIFCNPPFDKELLPLFVEKALQAAEQGSTVMLILPLWSGYDWFQEIKGRGQMQDVIGPIAFERADGSKAVLNNGRTTTPIVVATLGPHVSGGTNGPPIRKPGSENGRAAQMPASANGRPSARRRAILKPLSKMVPKRTEWLWQYRIPLGELTVIDGDPGVNKSSLLLDLAARISTGRKMPDGSPGISGGVLLLIAEDSLEKTVLKRLQAMNADLDQIAALEDSISLPAGMPALEDAAVQTGARLIIIDPLMAFLSPDSNSDQKIRRALTPLKALAERTNAAVVMVRHLIKRGGRHALYRGGGSIGIIAATRSALLAGRAPDETNLRVLCHTKCNLGPLAPSLLFEPVDADGVPQIEWRGECDYTADDLLGPQQPQASRLAEAEQFLANALGDGAIEQKEIKRRAIADGLAYRTVERAKEVLGVISTRNGWGPGSRCLWQLPDETNVDADT